MLRSEAIAVTKLRVCANSIYTNYLSDNQVSVPRTLNIDPYMNVLSEYGKKEYEKIITLVAEGKFHGYIYNPRFYYICSGTNRNLFKRGLTKTYNNIIIGGWVKYNIKKYTGNNIIERAVNEIKSEFQPITTSEIIYYTEDWVYTVSGSLYSLCKLGNDETY